MNQSKKKLIDLFISFSRSLARSPAMFRVPTDNFQKSPIGNQSDVLHTVGRLQAAATTEEKGKDRPVTCDLQLTERLESIGSQTTSHRSD